VKEAIEGLKPERLWHYFYEISQIPRESKNEAKAAEYIMNVAKQLGLKHKQDEAGNVLVSKPASPGKENSPTIVLQGHLDMVCEKNKDTVHDFSKDPIELIRDGEFIRAKGTTLGADNGIGIAAMLAIMEAKDIEHPPLEFLFTVDEETGLTGASALEKGFLTGKIMINCDSEEDNALYVGCAGGKDTEIFLSMELDKPPFGYSPYRIKVTGLKGGHSGLDIHLGRANAIKLMTRLLWNLLIEEVDFRLFHIDGGSKHNAIPRECEVRLIVKDVEGLKNVINSFKETVAKEYEGIEDNIQIVITEDEEKPLKVLETNFQEKFICLLYSIPHGVIKMSQHIPGLVETSTNLATVKVIDLTLKIGTSQRSSVKSEINDIANQVKACGVLAGAKVKQGAGYPGWTPNMDSEILKLMKATYKELFGEVPEVKAVHAGLECGIIGEKFPGLDMISYGPTIIGAHSPDERVNIKSVEKFWKLLTGVLKKL